MMGRQFKVEENGSKGIFQRGRKRKTFSVAKLWCIRGSNRGPREMVPGF